MGFLKHGSTSAHYFPSPLQMWVIVALPAWPLAKFAENGDKRDHVNFVVALNAQTKHCIEDNNKFIATQSILLCAFIVHILLQGVGRWTECQKQDENFSAEHGGQKFTWLLSVKHGFKRPRQQQSDIYRAPAIPFPREYPSIWKVAPQNMLWALDLKDQPDTRSLALVHRSREIYLRFNTVVLP